MGPSTLTKVFWLTNVWVYVADKGEPRRAITIIFRMVILGENTPNHVSINLNAEGFGHDEGYTGRAKTWIPAFEFDNSVNKLLRRTFRSGFPSAVR